MVAFFSPEMGEDMKIALHGRLVDLMVNILPQIYRQNVIYKKEIQVLYITLKKSLYGCLGYLLLFSEWLV